MSKTIGHPIYNIKKFISIINNIIRLKDNSGNYLTDNSGNKLIG